MKLNTERSPSPPVWVSALLVGCVLTPFASAAPSATTSATFNSPPRPLIVGGALNGDPPDSPELHIDANTITSPFGGVGSLFIDVAPVGDQTGFLCSSCAIHGFSAGKDQVRDYILTAAHCLDFEGGVDTSLEATGDGIADVLPQNVSFILNFGGNFSHVIPVSEIHLHPDWHGFQNIFGPEGPTIHDDIALLRLSSPLPAGVPTYNLATSFSGLVEDLTAVGYGRSGDPTGLTVPPSFSVKRFGRNRADAVFFDDESSNEFEVFAGDFDGPDETTNLFDTGAPGFNPELEGTLGNNVEATTGPGDSGSPSFLNDFGTNNLLVGLDGRPIVYGINTFSGGSSPAFGSLFGGMLVSRYAEWINSIIVPEPSTCLLVLAACAWILPMARRRQSG